MKIKIMHNILMVFIIVLTMISPSLAADYSFVSIKGLVEQEVGRIVLPQIYGKIGISIDITPLPGKRAHILTTTGKKDGEIMRIWTYGENNKTVARVPTPYYSLETMAFIRKDSGISILSKEDLAKYKIVKVRGVKHTDNITKGLTDVLDVDSTESMMKMLDKGRVQVALTNTTDGLIVIKKTGLDTIVPVKKPLAVLDLYHYVHEKHGGILDRIDATIKEMKASGELEAIIEKAEKEVIGKFSR